MNKLLFWLLIPGVILSACNRKTGAVFAMRDKLEVINPDFKFMSAKAKFRFDNGENRVAATANFRFQKDSIIWVSISGLGIEAARVFIDDENVRVLDRLNKRHYEYTFEELSDQYDFEFNFNMIQSVLLGILFEPYKRQKIKKNENYYSYVVSKGAYSFTNFISSGTMNLERVTVLDEVTKNTISVNYSDFILVEDQIFPNEISAIIDYDVEKKSNTEINISYNRMQIKSEPLKFPYSVSDKYERN
ncbi:MAG: DUF4292 domain-containing protein [Ekhidna sp.]|nr:DUF4292 domain-containing protein [Ekhidna sp.]MBC6425537.1 DUF4292 domain-containing protein [Ekhidna sp.]